MASKSQQNNNKKIKLLPSLPKTAKRINNSQKQQLRQKKHLYPHRPPGTQPLAHHIRGR